MLRVFTVLFVIALGAAGIIYYLESMPSPKQKQTVTKTTTQVATEVKTPVVPVVPKQTPAAPSVAPTPAPQTTAVPEAKPEQPTIINAEPAAPSQEAAPVAFETREEATVARRTRYVPRGYVSDDSESDTPEEAEPPRYVSREGSVPRRGSRMHALSREEVDARVGYVPEPEPSVAARYDDLYADAPEAPPVIYRQRPMMRQAAPACPPRYQRPQYRRHARRMMRRPSCGRGGCPQRQPYLSMGIRVVQPAYAVRPAYSGYGPAHR